jgi:hypothetical protein
MKKKYLQVIIYRGEDYINTTYYLLSDNVTGFSFEESCKETRLYFKNSNPFSFARIHITNIQFLQLMSGKAQIFNSVKEGTSFSYSLITI